MRATNRLSFFRTLKKAAPFDGGGLKVVPDRMKRKLDIPVHSGDKETVFNTARPAHIKFCYILFRFCVLNHRPYSSNITKILRKYKYFILF